VSRVAGRNRSESTLTSDIRAWEPGPGIRKLGFRRWYERQLIEVICG